MNENDERQPANNRPPDHPTPPAGVPPADRARKQPRKNALPSIGNLGEVGGTAAASSKPPSACEALPSVSGYQLVEELGRGGMGVVYKARHTKLRRFVALKLVLRGYHDAKLRFLAEAEAMAAIRHPNVIQVHDYGEHAGQPFLALEYLPGDTLAHKLKAGRVEAKTAAELLAKIARGVGAAHAAGIIHRDLKPANVLFDADGEPKVSDFGLAKLSTGEQLTYTGAIMGTPHYMSPEQAGGQTKFVGPPADVWALGVVLYECLTGKRPFEAETLNGILSRILLEEPVRPRGVLSSVPRDLELICLKCLEKEPSNRYATGRELATDLRRFAAGEPVSVREIKFVERALKWSRRKPTAAAAWVFIPLAVLLALTTYALTGAWRAAESAHRSAVDSRDKLASSLQTETQLRRELEASGAKVERVRYGQTINLAYQAWTNNDLASALDYLDQTPEVHRGWEYRYIRRLCEANRVVVRGEAKRPLWARISPTADRAVVYSPDKLVRLWDLRTREEIAVLSQPSHSISAVAFSPDGRLLATVENESSVCIRDASTGGRLRTLTVPGNWIDDIAFCTDGGRFWTLGHTSRLWDANTGLEIARYASAPGEMWPVFSRDGARVVTVGIDGTPHIWATGSEPVFIGPIDCPTPVTLARFIPDGSGVLVASDGGAVRVWTESTRSVVPLNGHSGRVCWAAFSSDGARVVTTGSDKTARVWDTKTGTELATCRGHTDTVTLTEFSPDGQHVVTTSTDRTTRLWDSRTGIQLQQIRSLARHAPSAEFSPDGEQVVAGLSDLRLWPTRTNPEATVLKLTEGSTNLVEFNPSGTHLVTGGYKNDAARLIDAGTGAVVAELKGHESGVLHAMFSTDGSHISTQDGKGEYRYWNARTGARVKEVGPTVRYRGFPGHNHDLSIRIEYEADGRLSLHHVNERVSHDLSGHHSRKLWFGLFDPTGSYVVLLATDGRVHVADVSNRAIAILNGGTSGIACAVFSDDGRRFAAADHDGATRVWDTGTWKLVSVLKGHSDSIKGLAFSSDGARILTGSTDTTARLWDAETGVELIRLAHPGTSILSVAFSPDGARLATACWNGEVRIWDSSPLRYELIPKRSATASGQ